MEKLSRETFELGQQWVKDTNDEKEPVSFTECKCNEYCKHLDCSVIKCKQLNKKC